MTERRARLEAKDGAALIVCVTGILMCGLSTGLPFVCLSRLIGQKYKSEYP
jgi:hypothetical protein